MSAGSRISQQIMNKTRNLRENSEMLKTKANDLSNDNELKIRKKTKISHTK